MEIAIILTTLFNTFATSPDLCAEAYVDSTGRPYEDRLGQTLSRYCQWTGPSAPVLASDVCCTFDGDGAACSLPDSNGRCWSGSRMYCEHGEAIAAGVICYQPLPDACEAGFCVQPPSVPPPGMGVHIACCSDGGVCQLADHETVEDCQGQYVVCYYGMQVDEETVECYD